MGVHRQGYYTTHIPAAPSESQAALVTSAVTRALTRIHARTAVVQLLYSPGVCDKSLRACQSWRAQRCRQAFRAVNDLSVCGGPPGRPLRGCSDKTGHVLTPVGPCSLLSGVRRAAGWGCVEMFWLTDNGAVETWLETNAADSETFAPRTDPPRQKTPALSLGWLSDAREARSQPNFNMKIKKHK